MSNQLSFDKKKSPTKWDEILQELEKGELTELPDDDLEELDDSSPNSGDKQASA